MNKLLLFALLVIGWGLVIYLALNPVVKTIHHYVPLVDFGESHSIDLGETTLTFTKSDQDNGWISQHEVTVDQFNQYRLKHSEDTWCNEVVPHCTNCAPPYTVAMVTFKGASDFCNWVTLREYYRDRLPEGYHFTVVRDPQRNYDYDPDKIVLSRGFLVAFEKKKTRIVQAPLIENLQRARRIILEATFIHPLVFLSVLGATVWSICHIFSRGGAKKQHRITDET